MKYVYFKTFGCRTNAEETVAYTAEFSERGYERTKNLDDADILVINGCSVTYHTEQKIRRYIMGMQKKNPRLQIALTGCLAQQWAKQKNTPSLHWLIDNTRKKDIADLVAENAGGIFSGPLTASTPVTSFPSVEPPHRSFRTRFSLKIQEGCDNYCSYCIVPFLRGPARSISQKQILEQAQTALKMGYREIIITGTHIGQFRDNNETFTDIIQKILDMDTNVRLRLSSMNPEDITEKLRDLFLSTPRLCPHLHISFQSLSAAVLKKMNRSPHTLQTIIPLLHSLKEHNPHFCIGGDFIVGHPGERPDDFAQTCTTLADYHICYGHVFRFSSRPRTAAAKMTDTVPDDISRKRSRILREALDNRKQIFYAEQKGTIKTIINEKPGKLQGMTDNYIPVTGDSNVIFERNQRYSVLLGDVEKNKVYAAPSDIM
jgi:threonylcarbamoyladenosine tRNA methylthiotransferase MtaB